MTITLTFILFVTFTYHGVHCQIGSQTETLFVNGTITPDNDKITAGAYCVWDGINADMIDILFRVYENNDTFVYNFQDGTASDELITYECRLLSAEEKELSGNLIEANGGCPINGSAFVRLLDTMPTTDDPIAFERYRTQEIILTNVDVSSIFDGFAIKCGGILNGDIALYYAACKRDFGFDSWSDVIITFNVNHTACVANQTTFGSIVVENPSQTDLTRRYAVTFDMYKSQTARFVEDLNTELDTAGLSKSDEANKVGAAGVALGEKVYLEGCVSSADSRKYFIDGASALGLRITNCMASPDGNSQNYLPFTPTSVPISDAGGCGLGATPAKQWGTDKYVFRYGRGGTADKELFRESPNCFRSEIFEAVSFARKNLAQNSAVIFTCDVAYCFNSTDEECFGDENNGSMPYPTCPLGSSRRRRETEYDVLIDDLPRSVSLQITVLHEDASDEETKGASVEDCFDMSTFIALTTVLVTVMVLFVTADIYMGLQFRKGQRGPPRSGDSGSTTSSYLSSRKII